MRFDRVALAVLLTVAAGCTVEPTPREYIDRERAANDVEANTREMISERLRLVVQSLAVGDPSAAHSALAPAANVRIYGPAPLDRFDGAAQLESLFELVAGAQVDRLEVRELEVQVEPRGTVGWFAAALDHADTLSTAPAIRVTGVYRLREGEWELSQAHFSLASDGITAPYPGGRPPPAAAESPPEDGPTRSAGS